MKLVVLTQMEVQNAHSRDVFPEGGKHLNIIKHTIVNPLRGQEPHSGRGRSEFGSGTERGWLDGGVGDLSCDRVKPKRPPSTAILGIERAVLRIVVLKVGLH